MTPSSHASKMVSNQHGHSLLHTVESPVMIAGENEDYHVDLDIACNIYYSDFDLEYIPAMHMSWISPRAMRRLFAHYDSARTSQLYDVAARSRICMSRMAY